MSRGLVDGLRSPHPLGERLPGIYLEDGFAQRLMTAFDEVLAPVLSALDNLEAYLDPSHAPGDFLEWLAGWVGLVLDESWPIDRRRSFVAAAMALYRIRGTARGLAAHVETVIGGHVEVEESGNTSSSTDSGEPPAARSAFEIVVRVRLAGGTEADLARVDALVAAIKPAHVIHRVEWLGS
jgi:phage tail-like protein